MSTFPYIIISLRISTYSATQSIVTPISKQLYGGKRIEEAVKFEDKAAVDAPLPVPKSSADSQPVSVAEVFYRILAHLKLEAPLLTLE